MCWRRRQPTFSTGFNNLSGDALLEYASGEITGIGAGAELTLNGPDARGADASDTATSSALTGLTSIGAAAFNAQSLVLINGAVVGVSGDLSNAGVIGVDDGDSQGGSTLTIGGTLTNTSSLDIGTGNGFSLAPTLVTLGGLDNTGTLTLNGGVGTGANPLTLDVLAPAPTTLTGFNNLSGDALLEYASGEITGIGAGAELTLNGPDAGRGCERHGDEQRADWPNQYRGGGVRRPIARFDQRRGGRRLGRSEQRGRDRGR